MNRIVRFASALWVVAGVVALPRFAMACATCFGASDAPQTKGMNMAILVLLVIIGGVLSSFAAFFLHLRRQSRLHRMPVVEDVDHIENKLRSEGTCT